MDVFGGSQPGWAALIAAQAGVVTHAQAREQGLTDRQISYRLSTGRWQRVHRGVYATFTGQVPRQAWLWAALLWAGAGAVLSHETALEVAGLTDGDGAAVHVGDGAAVHVTVPRRRRPAQGAPLPGVVVHRSDRARSVAGAARPPRTPVEDAILDLAATARAFEDAYGWLARGLVDWQVPAPVLRRALAARTRFPRRAWLIDALDDAIAGSTARTESRYDRDVVRAHGLPAAEDYGVTVEFAGIAARNRSLRAVGAFRFDPVAVTAGACPSAALAGAALREHGWPGWPRPCRRASCVLRVSRPPGE